MNLKILKLNPNAHIPDYGTQHSAGCDLRACLDESVVIKPGAIAMIPSGISIQISEGYFGMICPRSGLALKYGITVLNGPGIIDSDYRGEVKGILVNLSTEDFIIDHGMKFAQLIIMTYQKISWQENKTLDETRRGADGFGSTGLH